LLFDEANNSLLRASRLDARLLTGRVANVLGRRLLLGVLDGQRGGDLKKLNVFFSSFLIATKQINVQISK
jgi:hypothetical protein